MCTQILLHTTYSHFGLLLVIFIYRKTIRIALLKVYKAILCVYIDCS